MLLSPGFTEDNWADFIQNITVASIKFELLSMVAHQQVRSTLLFVSIVWLQANLDFQERGTSVQGNKGGVFVMYNCARLNTLFSNFDKAVGEGELYLALICSCSNLTGFFPAKKEI